MPLPFLLGALAVGAGVLGVGGHLVAKDTNEIAQRVVEEAQDLYNSAKKSLELAQNSTEKALLKLGYEKKNVLDSSMRVFLNSYEKVKNIELKESVGLDELSNFAIDQQGAIRLREMTDIYSSTIQSGATGAAAGAVIALAASGSLTVVTGGFATAGSALLAGKVTAAVGIAGSALSFGAAMTPLAAVAAPVMMFTGISASMKADENLEKANAMYAEAEVASEKMKVSETLCNAISKRSDMLNDLLIDLNSMFAECAGMMAGVIRKKEGKIFKKKLKSSDFTKDELKLMAVTRSLAGAVKSVIDTPIISKDGNVTYESEQIYEQTVEKISDFCNVVGEVRCINFNAKPVDATIIKNNVKANTTSKSGSKVNSLNKNDFNIYYNGKNWNFYDEFAQKNAWYTYARGDNFHTNRGVDFLSKLSDVISLYGSSNTYAFNEDSDIFVRIGTINQSQDILSLKTAVKYIYYSTVIGSDKASISFYFDSDNNLLLVGYLLGDLSR